MMESRLPHGFDSPRLDRHGRLDDDILCVRCAYDLRGLRLDNRCPECGTAIGQSLEGKGIACRDPEWIVRVARGWQLLHAATVLFLSTPAIGGFFAIAFEKVYVTSLRLPLVVLIAGPLVASFAVLSLIGVWMLAAPDPGQPTAETNSTPRMVRVTLAGSIAVALILLWFCYETSLGWHLPCLVLVPPLALQVRLLGRHVRHLAMCIPDRDLAWNVRVVAIGWFICAIVPLGGVLLQMVRSSLSMSGARVVAEPLMALSACAYPAAVVILTIWTAKLVERFHLVFQLAAQQARSIASAVSSLDQNHDGATES